MPVPKIVPILYGWRNVILIESFLVFAFLMARTVRPPTGYTAELLYAIAYLIGVAGGVVVAGIAARAANKMADRWEPVALRPPPAGGTPNGSPGS